MVKVIVADLALDPNANTPIMILKEDGGGRTLPIWIGVAEASAIALQKSSVKPERPLTHDLMKLLIDGFNATLSKVVIDDLHNNTFYAKLYLQGKDNAICIDARPSDAVALALRCGAPVYVEDKVLGKKESPDKNAEGGPGLNADELRNKLRNIDPSDFGKYSID